MSGTKRWSVYDSFDRTGFLEGSKPIWTPSPSSFFEGLPITFDPEAWSVWYPSNYPYVSNGRAFLPRYSGHSELSGMDYAYYGAEGTRQAFEAGWVPGSVPNYEALQKLLDDAIHRKVKFTSPYASILVTDLEFNKPSKDSLRYPVSGRIIHGNVTFRNPFLGLGHETDGLLIGAWRHAHGFYTDLPFLPGGSWLNSTLEVVAIYISRSSSPPPSSLSSFAGPIPASSAGIFSFPGHYVWGSYRLLTYFFDSGDLSEVGWQASNGIVNLKMPWTSGSSLADLGSGGIPYLFPPPFVPGKAFFSWTDPAFTDVTYNTKTLNWNNFCSQIPSSGAGSYSFDRYILMDQLIGSPLNAWVPISMSVMDGGVYPGDGQLVSVSSFKVEVDTPQGGGKGGWHVGGITAGAGGGDEVGFAPHLLVSLLPDVAYSVFDIGYFDYLGDYFSLNP